MIAEYDNGAAPASPSREYVYAGSQLLAKIEAGATNYYHPDHLSARVTTDASGNIAGQQGHYPFGDSWYAQSTTTKWQFTSYEHDPESGNDYAMMRSYINRVGRFSSPDPLAGSFGDPQSLNKYAYALNDTTDLLDPLGLFPNGPPQYVCETHDPFHFGCPPQGSGGGGGNCTLDGIATPCGTVIAVVQAGASTSSITGGAGGGHFKFGHPVVAWSPSTRAMVT